MRWLERVAIVIVSLAIAIGVIAVLSGGLLSGRDNPGISGSGDQLGVQFRDLGDALLAPGAKRPAYDSDPPTSGPHHPARISHDGHAIDDGQLLQALATGDIVFMYGSSQPPPGLTRLARSISAPFSPALASAGQAVILAQRRGVNGVIALAWTRLVHVPTASDPQLRAFALFWLGQGDRTR